MQDHRSDDDSDAGSEQRLATLALPVRRRRGSTPTPLRITGGLLKVLHTFLLNQEQELDPDTIAHIIGDESEGVCSLIVYRLQLHGLAYRRLDVSTDIRSSHWGKRVWLYTLTPEGKVYAKETLQTHKRPTTKGSPRPKPKIASIGPKTIGPILEVVDSARNLVLARDKDRSADISNLLDALHETIYELDPTCKPRQ